MKRTLARNHVKFYTIDAVSIAQELGLGNRTNTVLQAAFFKLSGVLPVDEAVQYMKDAITHSYFKKGDKVLNMNYAAVGPGPPVRGGDPSARQLEGPARRAPWSRLRPQVCRTTSGTC